MKLGVLAVVASLGGLFVLSKTENKASENVVFHARPWKKKRINNSPTQSPLWFKISNALELPNFHQWKQEFVGTLGWHNYQSANPLGLKPKWGTIDPLTGLLNRSIRYDSFDTQSVSIYNLLNPFMLNKFFEERGISDKRIADIDISYRGPNHTSSLEYLVRVKSNINEPQYTTFNKIYNKVKNKIPLPPRFTKKSTKQFVESFSGSTKDITLLNAFEQGKIEDSIDTGGHRANGDWWWLRWAQKNLYEMDEKDVLKIIFEIAAIPESAHILNSRFGSFYNCDQWIKLQQSQLDPQKERADNYRAPYKTITEISLITQMLSAMALIEELPVEATVLQQNIRGSWDVYVDDPYMQRYDRKIHLDSNRDVWDIDTIKEIWDSISSNVEHELMFNARMSAKAGRRREMFENKQEIDELEKMLDAPGEDLFSFRNPFNQMYNVVKVEMVAQPSYKYDALTNKTAKFPQVATQARQDKLKQVGIDEIDKRMQEALGKMTEVEDEIRRLSQEAKDEWDKVF